MKLEFDLTSSEMQEKIRTTAQKYFDHLANLPKEVRSDTKKRTGIQIFVREPGTRNFAYVSVGQPSEAAKIFAIEKAVRSDVLGDICSQDSEDAENMRFAGSVSVPTFYQKLTVGTNYHKANIQASVSGLKAEEDVYVAMTVLATIFNCKLRNIPLMTVENGGKVPGCFFDRHHYLFICPKDAPMFAND